MRWVIMWNLVAASPYLRSCIGRSHQKLDSELSSRAVPNGSCMAQTGMLSPFSRHQAHLLDLDRVISITRMRVILWCERSLSWRRLLPASVLKVERGRERAQQSSSDQNLPYPYTRKEKVILPSLSLHHAKRW